LNLQQLRYLCAIVDHGLNVSAAAESLFTSQPGISKQIRQLEDELGVPIFIRQGKRLTTLTAGGEVIVASARRALQELNNLRRIGAEARVASADQSRRACVPFRADECLEPEGRSLRLPPELLRLIAPELRPQPHRQIDSLVPAERAKGELGEAFRCKQVFENSGERPGLCRRTARTQHKQPVSFARARQPSSRSAILWR